MSNYEVLSSFFLAVPILLTKIEINWLLSSNKSSRVRSKINLHFQVFGRTHGKTRGGRIAGYLTNEQRSHAGWIGASKCEVIFERTLTYKLIYIMLSQEIVYSCPIIT